MNLSGGDWFVNASADIADHSGRHWGLETPLGVQPFSKAAPDVLTKVKTKQRRSFDLEDLLTTPPQDPCALFTEDADYVTFFIDMDLEKREVEMRVPKVFLEDRSDHENGVRHGAQLFAVMFRNFLPVTRRQTGAFSKAGVWPRGHHEHMTFVVQDILELDKIAELAAQRMVLGSPHRPLEAYTTAPFDYGLTQYLPFDGEQGKDLFIAHDGSGTIRSIILCSTEGTVPYLGCTNDFRSNGMDVAIDFRRPHLSMWAEMQSDVERFLSCATETRR